MICLLSLFLISTAGATVRTVPGTHVTIQGAIDSSAAGDTVRVFAGTYAGPIDISKSIVFIGSWPDSATVIEAPADFATNALYNHALRGYYTNRTIVHVGSTDPISVVLSGVVIDGRRRGPAIAQAVGYSGVLAEKCTLAMTASLVKNILPSDSAGSTWHEAKRYVGRGVEVRGNGTVAAISGNTFQDINRFFIMVNAADYIDSLPSIFPKAAITQNILIGKGIYDGGQKGIWFNHGGYGIISQNIISNFDYWNPAIEPDRATGVVVWRSDFNPSGVTIVEKNILTAPTFTNNKGIYVWGVADTVRENVITGYRFGVELHNERYPSVTRNTITGGAIGIMLGDERIVVDQNAHITIGGSLGNKNVITGQVNPDSGGKAIALGYRDPLNKEELKSPFPVIATYNDFGVYSAAEISKRIWDRGDTTLADVDTVLFAPFMVPKTTLAVKAFLQGPFTTPGDSMFNTLNGDGVLATYFAGAQIPGRAVDSVTIQVRDSSTLAASTKSYSAPAWLLTDGTIRTFTDSTKQYVEFPDTVSGDYYVVVRHRNHLTIMSAVPVACEGGTTPAPYDFTTAGNKAYGTDAMKGMGTGNTAPFALFAADANASGDITILDRSVWRIENSQVGYKSSDFNLDGEVTIFDRALWRLNNSLVSQVP
jgi:parallel beta-helix repeat protein